MKSRLLLLWGVFSISVLPIFSQIQLKNVYENKTSDLIGKYQGLEFYEGGFSGLVLIPDTDGKEFYTLSDRGIGIDSQNADCSPSYNKIFPFPNYVPKIHHIRIDGDSIQILRTITIKRPDGTGASGLLNQSNPDSHNSEKIWSDTISDCNKASSVELQKDSWGIDSEGITIGHNNDFWICEEGGTAVWHLNANGKVINRYSPYADIAGSELQDIRIDTVFKYRRNNRGFEGIAITPNGKIYTLVQSPLLYPNKASGEKSQIHRLLEINPADSSIRMYAYLNPGAIMDGTTEIINEEAWKIGDIAAINDTTLLVLEYGASDNYVKRDIYKINIKGATPVTSDLYNGKTLEQLKDATGLASENIIPVKKTHFLDLRTHGWPDTLNKAEGLTIVDDSTIAVCNDNNFGQHSAEKNGVVTHTNIKSYVYVFALQGENKIPNFVKPTHTIARHSGEKALFSRQITSPSDDMEEFLPPGPGEELRKKEIGEVDYDSGDIELGLVNGRKSRNPQMVGLRFPNIYLNNNTEITKAYFSFEVDAVKNNADPCNLYIWAEDSDSAATYNNSTSYTPFELTSRPKLIDSINWLVPMDTLSIVGNRNNSVDIAPLVRKLLNRKNWKNGNAMAFYIKGTGTRATKSFEGGSGGTAILNIEYYVSDEEPPVIAYRDSIVSVASALEKRNYTVPSYTLLKRAIVTAKNTRDSLTVEALITAMDELQPKEMPYNVCMSFNGTPISNMGFAWFTNQDITGGIVEIVEGQVNDYAAFSTPDFSAEAVAKQVELNYCVADNALEGLAEIPNNTKRNYTSNKALVSGLQANTTYSFRVGMPNAWSEIGTFTTAAASKDEFSFVYTTDPQAESDEMFDISQRTTHTAHDIFPNANFWLNCGDLVETYGNANSEWEYEQFFETQQDIFLHKPLIAVAGNHDQSSNRNFTHHFNTDSASFDRALSVVPGSVYSFVYGDALFMALSYESYKKSEGLLDSLSMWMRKQVEAHPDTKWRIAFYHKTMFTGAKHQQHDRAVRDKMSPVFDELKIDLALQGHDHVYEVIGPVFNKQLVPNSISQQISVSFDARENATGLMNGLFDVQQGTLYFLNNSSGRKKNDPKSQAEMEAGQDSLGMDNYFGLFSGRFGQTGLPTFSNIKVNSDTISIATYEVTDENEAQLFDSFKIVKSPRLITDIDNSKASENQINVYPIPVKTSAYINIKNHRNADVLIHSLSGETVRAFHINGSEHVDLNNLPRGIYILSVNAGTENHKIKFTKE